MYVRFTGLNIFIDGVMPELGYRYANTQNIHEIKFYYNIFGNAKT